MMTSSSTSSTVGMWGTVPKCLDDGHGPGVEDSEGRHYLGRRDRAQYRRGVVRGAPGAGRGGTGPAPGGSRAGGGTALGPAPAHVGPPERPVLAVARRG